MGAGGRPSNCRQNSHVGAGAVLAGESLSLLVLSQFGSRNNVLIGANTGCDRKVYKLAVVPVVAAGAIVTQGCSGKRSGCCVPARVIKTIDEDPTEDSSGRLTLRTL